MRVPGKTPPGHKIDRIVSSVDIYPTLMDLCSVEMNVEMDGHNMTPLLADPRTTQWRDAAWAYFNNGITLRTQRYRLTKYLRGSEPAIELFDHGTDPFENKNVAKQHPDVVGKLLPLLEENDFGIYKQPEGK
jgi:arylsulfatase A-like enzyme